MFEKKNIRVDLWLKYVGYEIRQSSDTIRFDTDEDLVQILDTMYTGFKQKLDESKQEFCMEAAIKAGDEVIFKDGKFIHPKLVHCNEKIILPQ